MSLMIPTSESWEKDCIKWRGKVLTGKHCHWCPDWDFLPIDETTPEWPCACADCLTKEQEAPNE